MAHSFLKRPGVGVTKSVFSVPLFSEFCIVLKAHVSKWTSRLYLAGVAAAQLQWHLSNMNVIHRIQHILLQDRNSVYVEINEQGFSNPHPWAIIACIVQFKIDIKYLFFSLIFFFIVLKI